MASAASLEFAAARLRTESARLERAISKHLVPAVVHLPEAWRGPAADQLEEDLLDHREIIRMVATDLRRKATQLDWLAEEVRRSEAAGASSVDFDGVAGAV
jgi:hypothetical protein